MWVESNSSFLGPVSCAHLETSDPWRDRRFTKQSPQLGITQNSAGPKLAILNCWKRPETQLTWTWISFFTFHTKPRKASNGSWSSCSQNHRQIRYRLLVILLTKPQANSIQVPGHPAHKTQATSMQVPGHPAHKTTGKFDTGSWSSCSQNHRQIRYRFLVILLTKHKQLRCRFLVILLTKPQATSIQAPGHPAHKTTGNFDAGSWLSVWTSCDRSWLCQQTLGLFLNRKKKEWIMIIVHPNDEDQQLSMAEGTIGKVDDFKYLGSWLKSSMKDFNTRRALAFKACDKLWRLWKSKCSPVVKFRVFRACVESVLLYGSEAWTLTESLEKRINGCYTRLLRKARGWT